METSIPLKNNKKYLFSIIIMIMFFLANCSTQREVYNIGSNRYQAACGGMLGGWDVCYSAANETCTSGIIQIDRQQINHPKQWNDLCACYLYPVERYLQFACR